MADAATTTFEAYQWLQLLGLGASGGALGQGVRTVVGLKKVNDAAAAGGGDSITATRLATSLALGAIAGAFAALQLLRPDQKFGVTQIFTIAAAGYAGADFIEGFVQRVTGAVQAPPAPVVAPAPVIAAAPPIAPPIMPLPPPPPIPSPAPIIAPMAGASVTGDGHVG